jgi:hypothetical protein
MVSEVSLIKCTLFPVRIAARLRAGRLWFDSWQEKYFSFLRSMQSDSGAHASSYPMGTGGQYPQE